MIIKHSWSHNLTVAFVLVILLSIFSTSDTDQKSYIVVAAYFTAMIPVMIVRGKIAFARYPFIICIIMVGVWLYGLILGIIKGNNISDVVRNFAGMTVYATVIPLMNSKVTNEEFAHIVRKISLYALFATYFTYIMLTFFHMNILFKIPVINAFVGGGGIGGFVQYFCRELIHVAFAYHFYNVLNGNRIFKSVVIVLLCVLETIFINDSGGDMLAMGVLAIVIVLAQIRRMKPRTAILVLIGIASIIVLYFYRGEGLLTTLFSPEDSGNMRRWVEINYFTSHMTLLGYGLGASLGHAGAGGIYSYGTEMIYLNIFHKFGIFALFIMLCYIDTCFKCMHYLRNSNKPEGTIPISLMAYLIPSLANPMLFSTATVLSHIIAMLLVMRKKSNNRFNGVINWKIELNQKK